jgi:hypothetical protein
LLQCVTDLSACCWWPACCCRLLVHVLMNTGVACLLAAAIAWLQLTCCLRDQFMAARPIHCNENRRLASCISGPPRRSYKISRQQIGRVVSAQPCSLRGPMSLTKQRLIKQGITCRPARSWGRCWRAAPRYHRSAPPCTPAQCPGCGACACCGTCSVAQ